MAMNLMVICDFLMLVMCTRIAYPTLITISARGVADLDIDPCPDPRRMIMSADMQRMMIWAIRSDRQNPNIDALKREFVQSQRETREDARRRMSPMLQARVAI